MNWFRKTKPVVADPVWALGVDSCAWIEDRDEEINGILVHFTKPGWSWTVLREDLPYAAIGHGRIVDMGPADTREEALRVGLEKMRFHMSDTK